MKTFLNRIPSSLLLLVLAFAGVACQDVIDLNVPEGETRYVVDAQFTDSDQGNYVRLSTTAPYFEDGNTPRINGATIVISDNTGFSETLTESDEEDGLYLFATPGVVGRTYTLDITAPDGTQLRSQPTFMAGVAPIDSIYFRETNFPLEDPDTMEYILQLDARDPLGVRNYYRWKLYVNGEYLNEPFDIALGSDFLADGEDYIGFVPNDESLFEGDTVMVEQIGISRESFDYWGLVLEQTAFVGGPFDPPPAPIPGNMFNVNDENDKVLGFFDVVGIDRAMIVIDP